MPLSLSADSCLGRFKKSLIKKPTRTPLAAFSGRSMIEMLGVLALVGVLSVGGIAGYSKAMWMYKTNKQAEQFGVILRALINNKEQFNIHHTTEERTHAIPILKAMGEIPDEMIIPDENNIVQDAFGLRYDIYHHNTNYLGIMTTLRGSANSVNICKNLYVLGKKFGSDIYYMEIRKNGGAYFSSAYGDKYCTSDRKCLKDLAPHDIDNLCKVCDSGNWCTVYFILWYYHYYS